MAETTQASSSRGGGHGMADDADLRIRFGEISAEVRHHGEQLKDLKQNQADGLRSIRESLRTDVAAIKDDIHTEVAGLIGEFSDWRTATERRLSNTETFVATYNAGEAHRRERMLSIERAIYGTTSGLLAGLILLAVTPLLTQAHPLAALGRDPARLLELVVLFALAAWTSYRTYRPPHPR